MSRPDSSPEIQFRTLVELLRHRASQQPDRRAFTFLVDGEDQEVALSHQQLDDRARTIAAALQGRGQAGDRALLLFPSGLDFIAAFFGCLYAGFIAVPAALPRPNRPSPRARAIAADAGAALALTTTEHLAAARSGFDSSVDHLPTTWLAVDELAAVGEWREPDLGGDSLAFLQYTSGSTREPRGVMLRHGNLLNNTAALARALEIGPEDCGVSWLPLFHDMGLIGCVLMALFCGAPAVLMSPTAFIQRPVRWLRAISRHGATVSGGPSFAYELCANKIAPDERRGLDLSHWRVALCGSEPIRADALDRFAQEFCDYGFRREALRPSYGLAEATLAVTTADGASGLTSLSVDRVALQRGRVAPAPAPSANARALVSCGRAVGGTQVVIADPESRAPCAADRVGEIWVSGPGVAAGYWNRPEESQQAFAAELADRDGGPYLRTGDLGFIRDGELYIADRMKDLIILRGSNYYPQDVELIAERSHPALEPNASAAFGVEVEGSERLVLVHELRRQQAHRADPDEVASAIRRAVAAHFELPVQVIVLTKPWRIPRTSSGKIRRSACRAAWLAGEVEAVAMLWLELEEGVLQAGGEAHGYQAPRAPVEEELARLWRDVLGRDAIGIRDDFFALGGDSLTAAQVVARARDVFRIELPLRSLFEAPTIEGLADHIEAALHARPAPALPPLRPEPRDGPVPLSSSQERMWFIHQLAPVSSAYHIVGGLRLKGSLDFTALERSLNEVVRRHEALRTTFAVADGQPVQIILPHRHQSLAVIEVDGSSPGDRETRLQLLAESEAARPLDLERGPLARAVLFRVDECDHLLLLTMHHIVSDAWSLGVLARETLALYRAAITGQPAALPELPIQYADFVQWEHRWLRAEALAEQMAYWRQQLADVSTLDLPTDRPRPLVQTQRGSYRSCPLPDSLLDGLRQLSLREGVTLFMALLAAFKVLLFRYTGQADAAVGTPVANRKWLAAEGLVGTFVNTLVMRTQVDGALTFRELLGRVREVALQAYAHPDVSLARLVAELAAQRDTSRSPLFQVMFNLINVPMPAFRPPGLTAELHEVDRHGAQFDLTLTVADTAGFRRASIEYNTDLFDGDTAARMLRQYITLLESILADPDRRVDELPILTGEERRQLLVEWNDTRADYPRDLCLHHLFFAQVDRTPEAVAVTCPAGRPSTAADHLPAEESLTYRELGCRVNQLACYLQQLGVAPGVRVGVSVERSTDLLVGLLGILAAGGAYVPLDPAFPRERLGFMIRDSGASILLTQSSLKDALSGISRETPVTIVCLDGDRDAITRAGKDAPADLATSADLAYILYTSGSTGQPKGVQIPHRALTNFLVSMQREPGLTGDDRLLAITTPSFDIAGLELYLPLITGARVIIAPRAVTTDGSLLRAALEQSGATVMQATPATWRMLIESGWARSPGLKMLCGGEALTRELADQLLARGGDLWNLYGPTETTIWSSIYQVQPDGRPIHLGHPIANTQMYILDASLQPVPIGVAGELCIGGDGVACGYLDRPDLNADRFIPDPFAGSGAPADSGAAPRLYRTGDLARRRADGTIEFLGRADLQVKIRGFRVEPGDVESALLQHADIKQAVVIAREDRPGDKRLLAYVVPGTERAPTGSELRAFLRDKVPEYMVPAAVVMMDALPLTPNRKVDRRALPAPGEDLSPDRALVAPSGELEIRLSKMWERLLGVHPIGRTDNFFDLGGHSLLVVRLFAEIERALGMNLPLIMIFEAPTVEQLAAVMRRGGWSPAWRSLVPLQVGGGRPPFFCIHEFDGNVFYYRELARHLGPDQPFYGLQAQGLDGRHAVHSSIPDMAAHYIDELRTVQPEGPYHLGGSSLGGLVAYEMAQQLHAQGQAVALLALFDTYSPGYLQLLSLPARYRVSRHAHNLRGLPLRAKVEYIARRVHNRARLRTWLSQAVGRLEWSVRLAAGRFRLKRGQTLSPSQRDAHIRQAMVRAQLQYRPRPYAGRITFFHAGERSEQYYHDPFLDREAIEAAGFLRGSDLDRMWQDIYELGWDNLAQGGLEVHVVSGPHGFMVRDPFAQELAAALRDCFDRTQAG